jgi:hypothetical protein
MVANTKGLGPEKYCAGKASSIYKIQTRPLAGEGTPQKKKEDRNCQTVRNIWS